MEWKTKWEGKKSIVFFGCFFFYVFFSYLSSEMKKDHKKNTIIAETGKNIADSFEINKSLLSPVPPIKKKTHLNSTGTKINIFLNISCCS